jgi:hypothetical protein
MVMVPATFQPLSVTVTVYEIGTLLPDGASYSVLSAVFVMFVLKAGVAVLVTVRSLPPQTFVDALAL